jgi:hypothetical protein
MSEPAEIPPPSPTEEPTMEIHKPKPVHSWREFLTELGVVVLGICIALGAEQLVERVHEAGLAREAGAMARSELRANLQNNLRRSATVACFDRRLD